MSASGQPVRRIVMAAFAGAETIDVVGPLEVFSVASRILAHRDSLPRPSGAAGDERDPLTAIMKEPHGPARAVATEPAYRVEIAAETPGPLRMDSGLEVVAARSLRGLRGPIDTLIVPGGAGVDVAMHRPRFVSWLQKTAPSVRRVASVCTGARLLAAAGLLRGLRATTHWRYCDVLARENPDTSVEPDSIFVRDGKVWTSAGVTAGMDLALAMVEQDHGRRLALAAARMMVIFLKRPGGQSQFSAQLAAQMAEREPLRDLQAWIVEHPDEDLRIEVLARRAAMSPRNFARAFTREVGMTPARFVEQARVDAARRRLEETSHGVDEIASSCGFGTSETMRRAFVRGLAISPSAYRARFRGESAAASR